MPKILTHVVVSKKTRTVRVAPELDKFAILIGKRVILVATAGKHDIRLAPKGPRITVVHFEKALKPNLEKIRALASSAKPGNPKPPFAGPNPIITKPIVTKLAGPNPIITIGSSAKGNTVVTIQGEPSPASPIG